ncbi:hypothetical protein MMC25_001681 [Agyrium rufum]|nr:hypothetical protein [Agyrium rufum]
MEKEELPHYSEIDQRQPGHRRGLRQRRRRIALKVLTFAGFWYLVWSQLTAPLLYSSTAKDRVSTLSLERLQEEHAICSKLRSVPKDPSGPRERSLRYVEGHKPVLIRNATVWTGEPTLGTTAEEARLGKGFSWINADVFMEYGMIKQVAASISDNDLPSEYEVFDAAGRQLTTGIVDMHSHAGVESLPHLRGNSDGNELSSDITPYVRSIDGLDPLDPQIQVIKSGGVTTSLILPGSGNNMGGEAYVIKHAVGKPDGRAEISQADLLADPERNWRYMKMACGENAKRVYGRVGRDFGPFSRLGEAWYFRHAFEEATAMVKAQDDWCSTADDIGVESMSGYLPQELKWESLGAALRGQVHINTHCYTVADLEAFVRHTNEFKFPIRAFHHAHQTYLVPEVLKRAYGGRAPAAAIFADNMYYKSEAYIGSEQAGKILYENGITPVYVSDNPVINAQHVVFEAAKGYMYGLPYQAAMASVTTAPAELLGLGERIGKVKAGFDGDVVVWDSDPMSVGATPVQVWIDGTAQFKDPVELKKALTEPIKPDESLAEDRQKIIEKENVVITGVSKIISPYNTLAAQNKNLPGNVLILKGKIACVGQCINELEEATESKLETIDLKNGYLTPSFIAVGAELGLAEIDQDEDTQDGSIGEPTFSRTVDGLLLDNKQLAAVYAHGIIKAITAPASGRGGHYGVSAGFLTGALQPLEKKAVFADEVALHYTFTLEAKHDKTPSISSAVGALRSGLLKAATSNETISDSYSEAAYLKKVVSGSLPLAIEVHSADAIAAVLRVKAEVESATSSTLRMVIIGGAESHLVASEIAASKVSVILAPLLAYAGSWDQRRSLTGAPLQNGTAIDVLLDAGVKTAIGAAANDQARTLPFMAGIAYRNGGGRLSEGDTYGLLGKTIEEIFGIESTEETAGFAVYEGNPLETGARIRAIADGDGQVSVWV